MDFLPEEDESAWAAAIEEWDSCLDLPQDAPPALAGSPGDPQPEHAGVDPLVHFIEGGEMEIPEGEGQALGSLLGSNEGAPARRAPARRVDPRGGEAELGISPDDVTNADVEVLVTGRTWDAVAREPARVHEEPTPVRMRPPDAATRSAEPPADDLDLDSLMQGLDTLDEPRAAPAAPVRPPRPRRSPAVAAPPVHQPLPLEVFDEIVPLPPEEPLGEILAGDMLPRPAEQDAPPTGAIPQDVEQTAPEPELAPPPIPPALNSIDLDHLDIPRRAAPIAPLPTYFEHLTTLLTFESNLSDSAARAASMEYMAGRALEASGAADDAIQHYQEVLNHQPGHMPALRALRRLHNDRTETDRVADVLEQMSTRVGDKERAALAATRAELLWSRNGDDDTAQSLLDAMPVTDLRRMLIQLDLSAAVGDDEALAGQLEALADRLGQGEVCSSLRVEHGRALESSGRPELARAAYEQAGPVGAAREGLIRTGLQFDVPGAVQNLIASAAEPGPFAARRLRRTASLAMGAGLEQVDVCQRLRDAAQMAPEDPLVLRELAESLRVRAVSGSDSGAPQEAVDTFCRLASVVPEASQRALALLDAGMLAEQVLSEPQRAMDLFHRASDVLPDSLATGLLTGQLKLTAEEPELRLEAHRELAASSRGGSRSAHHLAAGRILQQELGRDEEALGEYLEALEHDPANQLALYTLEGLFLAAGQPDRLAAMLDTAAAAVDNPPDASELRARAALYYEGPLANPEAAASRYRQIIEQEPGRIDARLGLHRSLTILQRWTDLMESMAEEATSCTDDERSASLWTAHGDLLLIQDSVEAAEQSYRNALDRWPGSSPATLALMLVHARSERWAEVGELWSQAMDALPPSSPQRRALLMRLASLQEFELKDPQSAVLTYEAALEPPLTAPGAAQGLVRSLRRAGLTERLTTELDRELDRSTDPATRFAVLVAAAELSRTSGIDWSNAESRLRRALEQVPDHPIGRRMLEQLYRDHTAFKPLADLYMSELKPDTVSLHQRVALYEKLAWLDLQQGDQQSACLSLESIVDLDPGHLDALRFLRHTHLRGERHDRLARLLRLEAEQARGSGDAASHWIELGRTLALHPHGSDTETEDDSPPISEYEAYLGAAERDPGCIFALKRLVDAARLGGTQEQVARHYASLGAAVDDDVEAAIYFTRAGELSGDRASYQLALERVPDYLGAIYRQRDDALRAEDWEAAYRAADAECRASHHPEHRTTAALVAGEIAQSHLGDRERAATAFMQALADAPGNRIAFSQLRQFLEEEQRWTDLAELLSSRAQVERTRPRLIELYRELAQLHRDRLEDRDQAKQDLRMLIKLDGEDRQALSDLADMLEADGEWLETTNVLIRLARLEQETAPLTDIFLRLGRIYHDKAPDTKRAIVSLRKVLALDLENPEGLERLSQLYIKEMDFERALAMATQLLERLTDRDHRVQTLLRVARIHEDGLKDPHRAAIAYRQALELVPTDLDAIGEVIGFFVRQGDQRSLMIHLDHSVATMRGLLRHNPLDVFSFQALFRIFGWRKSPDGCFCAAQVLDALGQVSGEERKFLDGHVAAVGSPGAALGDPTIDELLFDRSIPSGFRQVFRLLSEPFVRYFPGDIKGHGATRSDRIADVDHPARRIGDVLARDYGVQSYELYLLKSKPTALIVENTPVPSILVGKALLHEATEAEIQFFMGRSLWLISRAMILPAFLRREEMELLVGGIVRQYQPEFQPAEAEFKALQDATRKVAKAIPRKLKQELMPFALECSGTAVDLKGLGAAANRAGLLTCRSTYGALAVLCRMSGMMGLPSDHAGRLRALADNPEAGELLRFTVSDANIELRRQMHIAIQ